MPLSKATCIHISPMHLSIYYIFYVSIIEIEQGLGFFARCSVKPEHALPHSVKYFLNAGIRHGISLPA